MLADKMLLFAIQEMKQGLIDADLGGGLLKKRVSRFGTGKRSGYRVILATNKQDKWFFMYGFTKTERKNISGKETQTLKKMATYLLNLSSEEIEDLVYEGEIQEVLFR